MTVVCVASIHAGATHDLIRDGKTGFAMNFSNTRDAAQKIQWILEHPREARSIGMAGQRFIAEHAGLKVSAEGVVSAVKAVCGKSKPGHDHGAA